MLVIAKGIAVLTVLSLILAACGRRAGGPFHGLVLPDINVEDFEPGDTHQFTVHGKKARIDFVGRDGVMEHCTFGGIVWGCASIMADHSIIPGKGVHCYIVTWLNQRTLDHELAHCTEGMFH